MKKILTILASAATLFAFGEDINQGADFEAFTAGDAFSAGLNDSAQQSNPYYWYTADTDAANIISNYPTSGAGVPIASRPEKFADDENSKYLQVETTGKLYRTVKDNGGSADFTNSTTYAYSIADAPIYLDTLVKFTAADSVFGDDALENGDKIAIEYVEHESEGDGDPTVTNFVIRAGYFAQTVIATNYFAAVPADFDKDAWHRLTVRTFASIDAANRVGFVVYLDGTPLEYEDTVLAGDDFTATGAAANFYKEGCHALYPSFVQGGDFQYSISAAAFSGNGSLDDVVFTTTTPNFITSGEAVRTEITLGTGVADVKVGVESTSYEAAETNGTKFVFNLPAGTTNFVLDVTADTDNGYTFDAANGITASNDVTYVGTTITITGDSPALTVVGKRDNAYYMDGETKVGFATLTEAFASAPANATIKLGYNYSVLEQETTTQQAPVFTIGKNLVLDLNGKTLDGGTSDTRALFKVSNGYMLTIIDTVPGDAGSIVYGGTKGMFDGDISNGDVFIGSDADCGAVFIGPVIGTASDWTGYVSGIVRGKFTSADNTAGNGKFICATDEEDEYQIPYGIDVVDGDSAVSLVGDYWVVEPQNAPQPTTYTLTLTVPANVSVSYKIGEGAATAYTEPVSVESNATVTITAAPAENYTYTNVELGQGWTLSEGNAVYTIAAMEAATAVTVPTPTSAVLGTYQVTVIPTNNTSYVAAYTQGGAAVEPVNDVLTVTVGQTITITVTPAANYEYASVPEGWTAGANGVITKEISVAGPVEIPGPTAKSSYPTYIDTTDDTIKGKYDTWAQAYGADTASAYETAFLLNIAPDAEDQTLKPTAITMEGGKVVITANQTLTSVNGKVYVKVATTLAGLSTAEWAEATLSEGKVQVTPGSSDTAGFYKIKVDF